MLRTFGRRRGILLLPALVAAIAAMLVLTAGARAAGTATVSGTIRDAAGAVTGAQVVLLNSDGTATNVLPVDTTAGGSYSFTGVSAGTYLVRGSGASASTDQPTYYSSSSTGVSSSNNATPVTVANGATVPNINITLQSGATISGTVTNPAGAGVGDVTVTVEDSSGNEVGVADTIDSAGVTPGAALGSYSITGLPAGVYYLYFDTGVATDANGNPVNLAQQYYLGSGGGAGTVAAVQQNNAATVTATAGQTTTINQQLVAGSAITGTVTDAGTGAPLSGDVSVSEASTGRELGSTSYSATARTVGTTPIAAGTYTINGLPAGSYTVDYSGNTFTTAAGNEQQDATGYYGSSTSLVNRVQDAATVTTSSSSAGSASVAVPQGGAVTGTVTANGSPAGGIFVALYDANGNPIFDGATTSADGTYSITGLIPGTYKVGFQSGGANLGFQFYNNTTTLTNASTVTVNAGQTTSGINAALSAGGTVTGSVTNTAGKPVPDVDVNLEDAAGNVLLTGETASGGAYTITGVAPGTYYVEFDPQQNSSGQIYQPQFFGGKQVLAGSATITVTANATTSNVSAVLQPFTTAGQVAYVPVPYVQMLVTTPPRISGTPRVGDTLTAKVSGWTAGTAFRYQWEAGGKAIRGATSATLKLRSAQYRKGITVLVTGEKSGYAFSTVGSAKTKAVGLGKLSTKLPRISGTARRGSRLAVKTGSWTRGARLSYQWYAGGHAIRKATKATFTLTRAQVGEKVSVRVTGRLSGYSTARRTSRVTARVAA